MCNCEYYCDGMFGGGDYVVKWCVYDDYVFFGGCFFVDVVGVDICVIYNFQVGGSFQDGWCDFGCRVNCEIVILVDYFGQFFFVFVKVR